ncbi:MlaD family protein [Synechococcus sp. CCY 9618]|uniref:MlaD family protein n=1 Tax=Synechococcus sp. CCY 9618 TaxID=2815602 RepID=UPI001C2380A7|nr:MlaD family protein [Synechococcus sp. CCY 9618]
MRRSVREALVGFSLLAAIASGLGLWFWLRGISLSRNTWTIRASFADAAGLAERSPVSYRGVLVGNVRKIRVTDSAVVADLEITDPRLRLARPLVARVAAASLLGGDAQVSLLAGGGPLPASLPGPREPGCNDSRMVCDGGKVSGIAAANLDTVTQTVQNLLEQAEREQLVTQMVAATAAFAKTAKETEKLTKSGEVFLSDAQKLVLNLNRSVGKVDPILSNLNLASADAAKASKHVSNLAAALDNPRTLADLQATLANAKQLTDRWSAVGGDMSKLTGDPKFLDGIRSVSIGLGKFFEELYPARVDAARDRQARQEARRKEAEAARQAAQDRLAPTVRNR